MNTTLERPRFFPRQLVTPDDLTLASEYLRDKMRRHNRYLHGWGVVCGAMVEFPNPVKAWKVVIRPGYILGPCGDEILLDRDICFDLRTRCLTAAAGDPCEDVAPANGCCNGSGGRQVREGTWLIAVRYKEFPASPVRVYQGGCGCDDASCEYSRLRDGYEICVLPPPCPESHQNPPTVTLPSPAAIQFCSDPPADPWVILARVVVNAQGVISEIDNCGCRRVVFSTAAWWTRCNTPVLRPDTGGTTPSTPTTPTTPTTPSTPTTPTRPTPRGSTPPPGPAAQPVGDGGPPPSNSPDRSSGSAEPPGPGGPQHGGSTDPHSH